MGESLAGPAGPPETPADPRVTVRDAGPDDAVALCEIFQAAALHGGTAAYGADAQAWAQSSTPAGMAAEIAHVQKRTWVAVHDDVIVGFATMHNDEVDFCYVAPAAMGQGIGRLLMDHLEAYARQQGVGGLHVIASLNAVPFYRRMGYDDVGQVTRMSGGVPFRCLRMGKTLLADVGDGP